MVVSRLQIENLENWLESVTGQPFKRKIVQNDEKYLLLAWQNDTHVDYLFHLIMLNHQSFQVAFAVQRYRDIETHFDRRMSRVELERLLNDPRRCVRYLVGQLRESSVF